ncbi:repeat and FYVE domain-containing 3-like isoform X2 [Octopus vulgaris]|uniref:Repeat and FYVE domain-containing 3-like isoform X2 n=1 Tax=Octopus vulgaris TaxID=6645 RepID=A0AA36F486_OCTVU|nr:repeat and FYVE domain-containing 3-like isoform X2 [Octopus vulgaris]
MSFMRKLVSPRATPEPSASVAISSQDNALGLMHLRKLFAEFRQPQGNVTQKEQEDKLYNMLPLFCKVFDSSPSSEMTEKFGDILQFCSQVAKLMVTEIRRRASNQSTEAASCAIVNFLEVESSQENNRGWILLQTLNLLSTGSQALVDCMTAAALPSTLVKCLYLFFDLPNVPCTDVLVDGCQFTPKERRILLQKVFVQVLVRLCSHVSPAEELARKDDLSLLFNAITSWCHVHSIPWRKSAGEILVTLSRHGLTPAVVKYIHEKGCVRHCIENMQQAQDLCPIEMVEMVVTVFCFLKDSSEVSHTLLDDFRSNQGYIFLSEFLLKLELSPGEDSQQALRNLVLLVGSLTTCGFVELKPGQASTGSLFLMPGFTVPQATGKGVSVRNIQAFQVLQSVFLKATSVHLCSNILDVINSIYHQDNANYFILESQHTLSQFAEKIHLKPPDIQQKFFELLEFIVFNLNFVPCKELISLSILIKTQHSIECSIICMKSLLKILRYHTVYKDVFREVGMLEVMVTCLHRYAALLKDPQNGVEHFKISEEQMTLGFYVMEALANLLNGNSANASVFHECGGARCAHNMVPYVDCQHQALNIVQQLVLSPGGDDDMGTLLGLMHTAPVTALQLKTHILKSLLNVLRESHRTRTVFRKVGGFVYVMSVLVSMEGCLSEPPKSPWHTVDREEILTMLKTVFSTLTVAMRYEPANAKFFSTEVRYDSLTEAARLLGCFSNTIDILPDSEETNQEEIQSIPESIAIFEDFFNDVKDSKTKHLLPLTLQSACLMIRFFYDMALDSFDRPPAAGSYSTLKRNISFRTEGPYSLVKKSSTDSIKLYLSGSQDQIIVHPGAIMSIFHLLPAIDYSANSKQALELQTYTAELLKSVMRTERNQQIMCDVGFPHELLNHGNVALADESHSLHPPLQYMYERLAAQALTPKDLKDFLRLGSPLNCRSVDDLYDGYRNGFVCSHMHNGCELSRGHSLEEKRTPYEIEDKLKTAGGPVPLTRVKCLVSMTTPRDARMHGSSVTPAFVEFDMSTEGFGCLYLPSIAPQGPPAPSVVGGVVGSSDPVVIGGVGTGERMFPPQSGLTYSTWFCVDKFSSPDMDLHPVRLLTVVRNLQGRDENLICLSVTLMAKDRSLVVSTQETGMPTTVTGCDEEEEPVLGDNTVRFWCPDLTQEGQWHHLVLIFHRAGIMKNSSVSLFLDSHHVNTQKLHYVSPNLGAGGTASPTAFTTVFAYIGTPPQLRRQSQLTWKQGPCYLFEDIVSTNTVHTMYQFGPVYVGSFQSPVLGGEVLPSLVAEEKVMFGVHAHALSQMTITKIRKIYNKVDSKSIAKQLAMGSHENATPIRILHNSACHLGGPARSLGAILMGYLGVRTFCPRPVAKMLENVGGTGALLGLIAMATDVEGLYAAVKALVCVVRSNKSSMWDMDRIRGYQTLSMLYKKKRHLLNSHILHLTFSLVGTVDSGRESSVIPNRSAFEDLLCDLEVWHEAPGDLQKSLYEHFYELLTESSDHKSNLYLMREVGLVPRLLHILKDHKLSQQTTQTIASVISVLLQGASDSNSLLRLGQFLVSTIPHFSASEKGIKVNGVNSASCDVESPEERPDGIEFCDSPSYHNIRLRNNCLELLLKLLSQGSQGYNYVMAEEIDRVLGFDWILLFMQSHLHRSTVILALRILILMLRNGVLMQRFREGGHGGGWLDETETVLKSQMSIMLGLNVSGNKNQKREINTDVCHVPGFLALQWILPYHNNVCEVYFLLMALLLGQRVNEFPPDIQLNLDAVWTVIFGVPASKPVSMATKESKIEVCLEASLVILSMIRSMLNEMEETGAWLNDYPVTLMQFLLFLYHNQTDFAQMCSSADFISALAATLFPHKLPDSDSDVTTPVDEFKPFPECDSSIVYVKTPEKHYNSFLTGHAARKFVIDFLRTIVVDSFSQPNTNRSNTVVDLVLEAMPEHALRAQQREYQTEIIKTLMDHLLAADVLLGEQAALPIALGGSYVNMANNVFYFASRVVDKLWQGVFTRESKEVFEFVSKLISQAKRKASGLSLDSIYRCLNRTILFQLSRTIDNVAAQTSVLDALHKLTNNRSLVFGVSNVDQEFLGCLSYCLLQLTDDPVQSGINLNETRPRVTTWHVDTLLLDEDMIPPMNHMTKSTSLHEGLFLVASAAKRVWEELYVCKKPVLEEIFRTQLNTIDLSDSSKITSPDLATVRPLILESASRIWVSYAELERRSVYMHTDRLQTQIQSKLQKVSSGVLRLASRKTKKELPLKSSPATTVHSSDFFMWTNSHVSIVKDLVEFQFKQYMQSNEHMEKYLLEEWSQTENELLRERGLWGPLTGSRLDKWMLDMTEGPCRMRKKLMRNDMFYNHYPYRPNMDSSPLRYKVAISRDSRDWFKRYRPQSFVCNDELPIQTDDADVLINEIDSQDPNCEVIMNIPKLLPRRQTSVLRSMETEDDPDEASGLSEPNADSDKTDNQTENQGENQASNQAILRLLGEGEKITHMFRCARIQGLDTAEGLLQFGKEHFYVIDGFTLLKSKEIKDIDSLPPEFHEPIIPRTSKSSGCCQKRICSKFSYDDIREVHKRRYLLQPIAVEVFSADGRNYLLAFPRKVRNKVYAKFLSVATAITDNAQQSVSGQKQNAKIESSAGIISSLMGEKSVTQRWERGEINNFQYLMHLNTLAGRSYNDLMQYPVFPWILADYDSEELDLTNPASFRDLSKPMGAQTPDRLKQFKKRYHDWDDPQGETPPYHYGTHYSSAMIVASYLVRMEPFTQHFLKLQGGHFDLADRMFHSVKECWLSASKHNMADVKELIPEFFYLPDFLLNANNFDLGSKQNGVILGDVNLPTWSKEDAREFIRVHREALECDYVSSHLHEWIDLIFGYKQRGRPAVDATNVFHYLFYEGNVDIYSIEDPLKKNATIGFINNFGQIPKQLFKKPHPQKRLSIRNLDPIPMTPTSSGAADKLFFHNVDNLKPTMQPYKELKGMVGQIIHNDKYVLAVEQNKVLIPPNYNRYLAWGFSDLTIRLGNYESDKATNVFESLGNGEVFCAACPNSKIFVTGGTSTVVNVWEYKPKEKRVILKGPLYGHNEAVTCLAASPAYNVIVSGSRDRSCIIWDLNRLLLVRQLRGHAAPVAAVCVNELTGDIATCAGTYLYVWTINGEVIASVNTATARNQQIYCVAMSQMMEWDTQNVILTGSSDGVVRMWSVEFVQVPEEAKCKACSENSKEANRRKEDETDSNTVPPVTRLVPTSSVSTSSNTAPINAMNGASKPTDIPRMTRRESCDSYSIDAKAVADRLKEFKDPDYLAAKEIELGSSAESENYFVRRMGCKEDMVDLVPPEIDKRGDSNLSSTSSTSDIYKTSETGSTEDLEVTAPSDLLIFEECPSSSATSMPNAEDSVSIKSVDHAVDALAELQQEQNFNKTPDGIDSIQDELPGRSILSDQLSNAADMDESTDTIKADDQPDSVDFKADQDSDKDSAKSSSSDYVVVSSSDIPSFNKSTNDQSWKPKLSMKNHLREGFRWQRQLVFRSKLTMHTAFERKDNKDPAAVTTIAVSKDHKTIYVGDARGRIYSWTVTDQPGRVVADHWMKDEGVDSCLSCRVKFSFSERRHHCRNCGQVFCSKCSRFETEIRRLRIMKPVRVCQSCYNMLRVQPAANNNPANRT